MTAEVVELHPRSEPQIRLAEVRIGDRARKDYGDLASLKASIAEHGLLQPIVLLPGNYLLCGGRRLEAFRQLGEESIPFRRVSTQGDAISRLKAERDENTCRKDMTPSELVAIGKKLEELKRPEAEQRQRDGQRLGGQIRQGSASWPDGQEAEARGTRAEVAEAIGMSESTYKRAKRVVEAANDPALDPDVRETAQIARMQMDDGSMTVSAAERAVIDAMAGGDRADPAASPAAPSARLRKVPREQRVEQIRALADTGRTSAQIGDDIGVGEEQVRRIAKEAGITITADELLRGTRRFKVDHNHVIDHLAMSLDALLSGLSIVNYDALDIRRIEQWVMSLTASRTQLNACIAEIKKRSAL